MPSPAKRQTVRRPSRLAGLRSYLTAPGRQIRTCATSSAGWEGAALLSAVAPVPCPAAKRRLVRRRAHSGLSARPLWALVDRARGRAQRCPHPPSGCAYRAQDVRTALRMCVPRSTMSAPFSAADALAALRGCSAGANADVTVTGGPQRRRAVRSPRRWPVPVIGAGPRWVAGRRGGHLGSSESTGGRGTPGSPAVGRPGGTYGGCAPGPRGTGNRRRPARKTAADRGQVRALRQRPTGRRLVRNEGDEGCAQLSPRSVELSTAVFHSPTPFHVKPRVKRVVSLWTTGGGGGLDGLWITCGQHSWTARGALAGVWNSSAPATARAPVRGARPPSTLDESGRDRARLLG